MNIVVTGGAGYLGQRLIPHLIADRNSVTVIDNEIKFCTALMAFQGDDCFEYVVGDITKKLPEMCIDAVIHLAALWPNNDPKYKEAVMNVNASGTKRVLEWAEKCKAKRFIFASDCVYAQAPEDTLIDEDSTHFLDTQYATSKLKAEEYVLSSKIGLVLRLAEIVGPSPLMRYDTFYNSSARSIGKRQEVFVKYPGVIYPVLHISDAVDNIIRLLHLGDESWQQMIGKIYNVASCNLPMGIIAEWGDALVRLGSDDVVRNFAIKWDKITRKTCASYYQNPEEAFNDVINAVRMGML